MLMKTTHQLLEIPKSSISFATNCSSAEVMEEEKEKAWEGGRLKLSKGHLGEVLALQAARGNW